jgi:hypothetical protein
VKRHSEINVLVVNAPNKFDLGAHSCVNYEVKAFNRKSDKHMKSFHNASTSDRDNFTHHGLHLNRQGKEQAAKTNCKLYPGDLEAPKEGPHKNGLERRTKS